MFELIMFEHVRRERRRIEKNMLWKRKSCEFFLALKFSHSFLINVIVINISALFVLLL